MSHVLVIGSGGREHALCYRLSLSASVSKVYCAPGNAGIAADAECVTLATPEAIIAFCRANAVALVVIGPEQPLVEGLADRLRAESIPVFGPTAKAAMLEGSKGFTKALCRTYNIPTAAYGFFDNRAEAETYLATQRYPVVLKADGLAAGKGVVIAQDEAEAKAALNDMFGGKIAGGSRVVIEEFMEGEEVSFFALTDGEHAELFGYAQDHKRAYDGDQGPNTGGMGTYAPPPCMDAALAERVMREIIRPTVSAMKQEGTPFCGVLFAGLMLTQDGPKLVEYNARFGDPETQSLMMLYEGDLFALLLACAKGRLHNPQPNLLPKREKESDVGEGRYAVCVVMAARGYPGAYAKGSVIRGLEKAGALPGVKIFHAGTQEKNGEIIAAGGRVLGVTAVAGSIREAQAQAYRAVDAIDWPEGFCRRDIAWRALS